MNTQPTLFPDPDKPCTACRGTGRRGPVHDERVCLSCGGTGRECDRPDPETVEMPF